MRESGICTLDFRWNVFNSMSNILDKIVATKREEIASAIQSRPIEMLKDEIASSEKPRDFFYAVSHKQTQPGAKPLNLIAEVKKASPSAGVIRADFDPVKIATAYEAAGADALSVLTDEQYFQGHLDYLKAVKKAVTLPVLRKDFIIDSYQIYEARAAGADAILLIAECLDMSHLIDLQILAVEMNMTVLIEVHDMENLIRVRDHVIGFPHKSYSLLGINNRDLRTFKTDLGTSLRLAELTGSRPSQGTAPQGTRRVARRLGKATRATPPPDLAALLRAGHDYGTPP